MIAPIRLERLRWAVLLVQKISAVPSTAGVAMVSTPSDSGTTSASTAVTAARNAVPRSARIPVVGRWWGKAVSVIAEPEAALVNRS